MNEKYENLDIPQDYDIIWEKWVDAYDQSVEQEDQHIQSDEGSFATQEDEFSELETEGFGKPIQTIMTPFGFLPLTEQSLASKYFKFWVGHTNFRITNRLLKLIQTTDGVETVDVLTPYRFRIAVGVCFSDRNTMSLVKSNLINSIKSRV